MIRNNSLVHRAIMILSVLFLPLTGWAQEQDPFFPKDFAKDPLGKPLTGTRAPRSTPFPERAVTAAPRSTLPQHTATVRPPSQTPLGAGVRITKIGAVVSGLEVQHLNETLLELKKVAAAHNFDVGTVYVVGIPLQGQMNEAFGQQMLQLAARGGLLQVVDAPPEGVPVSKSPTWIVRTEKGDVILEGFTKLTEFVAHDGTLLEPTNTSSEVVPLAEQTVEPTPTDRQSAAEREARRKLEELKAQLP